MLYLSEYPIYKDKVNNIYIDINNKRDEKNLISVEIIYLTTKNELLPKYILYDKQRIIHFDTYQNKLRQRVGLFNINPEKLSFINDIYSKYPDFKFEKETSYKIFIYISNEGNTEYSIDTSELDNHHLYHEHDFKINTNKKNSLDLLFKFKQDYFELFIKDPQSSFDTIEDITNKIDEFEKKYSFLITETDYYENITNYNNFEKIDLDIFNLMFYYLEFLELIKIRNDEDKKVKLDAKLIYLKKLNEDYEKYILEVKNLNINIKDKLSIIKAYNKKFTDSFKSGYQIDYISTLIIEKAIQSNPYKEAINFIKKIILNLKEESRLFEVFLYLDSDTINNLLIKNEEDKIQFIDNLGNKKQIEYQQNPTEYGINMSNIDEIKNHLFKLIPKYIIRIDTQMKFNADYDRNSIIISLNEKVLFNENSSDLTETFKNKKMSQFYVLPIVIEILHELFAHGKKRLIDNKSCSPEAYRDSKKNYKRMSVKRNIKNLGKKVFPESGVVLENYISNNRIVLKWLRTIHGNNKEKLLLDVSLWVDKDFSKLEKIIENYIKSDTRFNNENTSLFEIYIHPNDVDYIDYNDDTCGFHKYE